MWRGRTCIAVHGDLFEEELEEGVHGWLQCRSVGRAGRREAGRGARESVGVLSGSCRCGRRRGETSRVEGRDEADPGVRTPLALSLFLQRLLLLLEPLYSLCLGPLTVLGHAWSLAPLPPSLEGHPPTLPMDRFLPLDVTLHTLNAHLYPDELVLAHADAVGLYDGKDKSPLHTDGRALVTSHRLVWVSSSRPHAHSVFLPLDRVRQTEYWGGFLKSSPKVTLLLADPTPPAASSSSSSLPLSSSSLDPSTTPSAAQGPDRDRDKTREAHALAALAGERNWVCRVCGMHNVPTLERGLRCSLCGVAREAAGSGSGRGTPRGSSPPPRATSPPRAAGPLLDPAETGSRLACPVCTFLNHHSMTRCEVCDSVLVVPDSVPPISSSHSQSRSTSLRPSASAPPSRADTPTPSTDPASATPAPPPGRAFVRLSFRRGGDRAFYAAVKEALGRRAWEGAGAGAGAAGGKGAKGGKGRREGEGLGVGGAGEGKGGVGIGAFFPLLLLLSLRAARLTAPRPRT